MFFFCSSRAREPGEKKEKQHDRWRRRFDRQAEEQVALSPSFFVGVEILKYVPHQFVIQTKNRNNKGFDHYLKHSSRYS
jgi:hypothetical protein